MRIMLTTGLGLCLLLTSCSSPPSQPGIRVSDSTRLVTYGINPDDYNAVANEMCDQLLLDADTKEKKVLVMGPLDDLACQYRFDPRRLSDKLQTRLTQSGRYKVFFAADALGDRDAAQSRYQLMQLQWEKESAVAPEDLRTLGGLADIEMLLFGRVSSQTVTQGDQTEVTYTYNWKLGDCDSGLVTWSHEKEYTKAGPRINGRFDPSRRRIPVMVAPTAFHAHSAQQYPALVKQWQSRGYGNAVWQSLEDVLYDVDMLEIVTVPPADQAAIAALLAGKGGNAQMLQRFPAKIIVPNMNFFESSTEQLSFGRATKSKLYHVELFLSYYELDGAYVNTPVLAKGEARGPDLLSATSEAARMAVEKLIRRVRYQWENQL